MEEEGERFFFTVIIIHAHGSRPERGMQYYCTCSDKIISKERFRVLGHQAGTAHDLLVRLVNISLKANVADLTDGEYLLDACCQVFMRAEFFLEQCFTFRQRLECRGGQDA